LRSLYLDYNQLSGEIPDLSALTQLERLGLMDNQLSGEIPDLSALTQLRTLFLRDNQLVSEIPPSITSTSIQEGNLALCGGANVITTSDPDVIAFVQARDADWTPGCTE
jgi:Leucine-rich repeat (LRR) protein